MNSELVEIAPRELKFIFEPKKQSSCSIHLINKSQYHVAFKVKTTSPKKYCVRPNTGIIGPKSSCDFTVTMQAQKAPPPDMACKDKFLVQSTVVSEETVEDDITSSMFSKDDGKYVQENKMRVILVSPPSSPVLSTINGVHSDLPACKDSPRGDQVHGVNKISSEQERDVNGVHSQGGICEDSLTRDQVPRLENQNSPQMDENVKELRKENADMQMEAKHMQLETKKHGEEMELVKNIESMKSKISELEQKLSEAKDTIARLTEERKYATQERDSLRRELVMLTSTKGRKKVRVGFPLLYVVTVALISMVFGYLLHF